MCNPIWWVLLVFELIDFFDVTMSEINNTRPR